MSVDFSVKGVSIDWNDEISYVNMANSNAGFVLNAIGLFDGELYGEVLATEFRARVNRALWPEFGVDPGTTPTEYGGPGTGQCRVVNCGRPEGYLQARLRSLLDLAERAIAKDGEKAVIRWG